MRVGFFCYLAHAKLLMERTAIDADAHGLAVIAGDATNRGELLVAALARADVTRIDAIFIESAGALGIFRQQDVAVVVKIADQGSFAAGIEHALLDFRHRGGGLWDVYLDANHFGACGRQFKAQMRRGMVFMRYDFRY